MAKISMIGLDLAKKVFQIHGIDATGNVVLRRQLRRAHMEKFFAQLAPTVVGWRRAAVRITGPACQWSTQITAWRLSLNSRTIWPVLLAVRSRVA